MKQFNQMNTTEMIRHGHLKKADQMEQGKLYVMLVDDSGNDELYVYVPHNNGSIPEPLKPTNRRKS